MASHSGLSKTPSEMRIILLGYKTSGMSSSGNTILGSEQFSLERTGQCEKRQGDVGGRQVTVVNTPGWFINESLKETPELIKQEIVLSASLCPAGPDALLLVIRADESYTADWYKNMEEHVQLLSERVWSHTMILFTKGDRLGGKSIEQHIKSEGEGLQRLVKLCGNRYHVFNNKKRGDDTQVTQLLDKIQEVAGEKGGCFEIDRRVLEETVKKRRTQDEGAARRQMKVKEQRESIRSMMGDDLHLSEMRIILLGCKGSGKSSSGNTILGSEQFSLERTDQCEKRQGDVGGRQVTVVNTPGWWKDDPLNETPELIRQQIALSASLCPPGPDALLLVIRAGSSCTADWYKNMEEHVQLLGQTVWSHTMILFTQGDYLGGKSIEHFIQCEGEGLQRLVELCGNRYHVFNNKNRGDDTQVTELLLKIEEMEHYGTGRPATPDTQSKGTAPCVPVKPKAVAASVPAQSKGTAPCVPVKPKAVAASVPAQSKGTAPCVPETSLFLGVTQTTTIKDSKDQDQKVNQDQQDQSDQVEKLTALLKERERELQNTITAMEDSKREQLKVIQEQRDQAEKLTVQMKERENTIKEMEDSKSREQQYQRDHSEMLTVVMKEMMREELEKIQRQIQESDQKRASATQQHLTQMVTGAEDKLLSVRKEFIQRVSEPVLNELLDELLHKRVISREELDTANEKHPTQNKARHVIDMVWRKGKKASSLMIITIHRLDQNLQLSPSD